MTTSPFDYSDQSPEAVRRAAAVVAEGCRFINHATMSPGGLKYPSDVDAILVELDSLAERLPQLLDQMDRWVAGEAADGRIKVTHGPYAGAPAAAVADLGMHLRGASACMEGAREALHGARQITAAMTGPAEEG